jgi:hypothetical protein
MALRLGRVRGRVASQVSPDSVLNLLGEASSRRPALPVRGLAGQAKNQKNAGATSVSTSRSMGGPPGVTSTGLTILHAHTPYRNGCSVKEGLRKIAPPLGLAHRPMA